MKILVEKNKGKDIINLNKNITFANVISKSVYM